MDTMTHERPAGPRAGGSGPSGQGGHQGRGDRLFGKVLTGRPPGCVSVQYLDLGRGHECPSRLQGPPGNRGGRGREQWMWRAEAGRPGRRTPFRLSRDKDPRARSRRHTPDKSRAEHRPQGAVTSSARPEPLTPPSLAPEPASPLPRALAASRDLPPRPAQPVPGSLCRGAQAGGPGSPCWSG